MRPRAAVPAKTGKNGAAVDARQAISASHPVPSRTRWTDVDERGLPKVVNPA